MKAIIFGASKNSERLYSMIKQKYEVVAYADNDEGKWGGWLGNCPIIPPDKIPETAPARLVRFQNREHTTSGPKAEPSPAHASDTNFIILLSGSHAIRKARMAIMATVRRLIFKTFLSSASGLIIFL